MQVFVAIVLLYVFAIPTTVQAQTLNYELRAFGIHLGFSTLKKTTKGELTHYKALSELNVNFVFTESTVIYKSQSTYKNDLLIESQVDVFVNDNLRERVNTQKIKAGYLVTKLEGEESNTWTLPINRIRYSSSKLFFERPSIGDTTLAEPYGNLSVVKKTKENNVLDVYNLASKSKTVYSYQNERPVERRVEYPLMDFKMFLLNETP